MPISSLPHDVLEVIFEHLRNATDVEDSLRQGFLVASVCRDWRDYGYRIALRDLLLPSDGGKVLQYLLKNPQQTDFVSSISINAPKMNRQFWGERPTVEEASAAVIELLGHCPKLTYVHLKNISNSSAALAKLADGPSSSTVKVVDYRMSRAGSRTSMDQLAKMSSLETLRILLDTSDEYTARATASPSNVGTHLALSKLEILLSPGEGQAADICADVAASTDPLRLLDLTIFNLKTETELWPFASASNLRSLRLYGRIGDLFKDLLDFLPQLSSLRKLDLWNHRPFRLEPNKDSLIQSVLESFPPSLAEGTLMSIPFPLSEQKHLKRMPEADTPEGTRFFYFQCYTQEEVSSLVMAKIPYEGQVQWVMLTFPGDDTDTDATASSAGSTDDES
ncbi:Cell wall surface anchored protein [Rhodotorula toruloides ATCC 204091]|uniref:Cell wall surface anchored protein n=1 Tax=Rhodotorula toruloides TaxID=5286 RepID=A0A0K3CEF1_RHOTO|nr:Cell wall surface anchored protein [Rhodotorula toruloides ATCC 204091]KAK4336438.1 Cell wall surface anchored protein [Rhodotorula toruloides]PRQ74210.1 cell wall surface anchored protein [Rhodotorula toruloides]